MIHSKLTSALLSTTSSYIKKLNEMGIFTVSDMLQYYPRNYEDRTNIRKIHEIDTREINIIRGKIINLENLISANRKKITRAEFGDNEGNVMEVIWFNQPHLKEMMKNGKEYILAGKVKREFGRVTFVAPDWEEVKPQQISMGRIIPIYPEYDTAKKKGITITSDWLRKKMPRILPYTKELGDFLPARIIQEEQLLPFSQAVKEIHFPTSGQLLEKARKTIAFQELFILQLQALKRKYDYQKKALQQRKPIPLHAELVKDFIKTLPFQLTDSQRIVTYQIFKDMEKPYPMIRLLQGDVGSGKTIVATIVAYHTIKNGYQVAFMVPTEILAQQHYKTLQEEFKKYDINVALLTGSIGKKEKEEMVKGLKNGSIHIIIGTHALIQEHIGFHNLGFVIIDEQHRFGVDQRKKLATFGYPHVLHMTATPIPRTLALTIYGDQDLSILKEMPKGRIAIITRVIPAEKRDQSYRFIASEIIKGRQAYVICPLIEESEKLQVKAVTEEYKSLKETVFAQYNIGLLHGRLKSEEKEKIMKEFHEGKIHLLVSTTVIEVGIDVKNGTIMMIEGADRFGLSQLHQLRGRVGRSTMQSYCFLFSDATNESVLKRLSIMEKTNSGYTLAEMDLKLRGAGELYGIKQSGFGDLRMADVCDIPLIEKTRSYAEKILEEDEALVKYPKLVQQLGESGEWVVS